MADPDVNLRTGAIQTGKVIAAKIGALAVTTAKIAANAVTTAKLAAGAVTTTELGTKAATGVKIDEAAFKFLVFTGKSGTGACTLTGAKVGDKVLGVVDLTNSADASASFESTITVADQIQQSSASDLHLNKHSVILLVKS